MAIIEGTAYWASLTRPNEKFEPMWRIDLAVDSKSAEDFKGQGISVAETTVDEKTSFFVGASWDEIGPGSAVLL